MQTNSLDSCSRLTTHSELTASEVFRLSDWGRGKHTVRVSRETECLPSAAESQLPDCYLFRLASCPFSYAEMIPPGDARHTICEGLPDGDSSAVAASHAVVPPALCGAAGKRCHSAGSRAGRARQRNNDQAIVALRDYASLLAEALPLTT